jgi:hypothetical protein
VWPNHGPSLGEKFDPSLGRKCGHPQFKNTGRLNRNGCRVPSPEFSRPAARSA